MHSMAQSGMAEKYPGRLGDRYCFFRRAPTRLRAFYPSEFIRIALGTRTGVLTDWKVIVWRIWPNAPANGVNGLRQPS